MDRIKIKSTNTGIDWTNILTNILTDIIKENDQIYPSNDYSLNNIDLEDAYEKGYTHGETDLSKYLLKLINKKLNYENTRMRKPVRPNNKAKT